MNLSVSHVCGSGDTHYVVREKSELEGLLCMRLLDILYWEIFAVNGCGMRVIFYEDRILGPRNFSCTLMAFNRKTVVTFAKILVYLLISLVLSKIVTHL